MRRFRKHGAAYLRFITTPGMEPTNHLAEQAIRFVVIDRYIIQGSRSAGGRRWLERIWTTMATCAQQGRSAFKFLLEAVIPYFHGGPAPSLLPDRSYDYSDYSKVALALQRDGDSGLSAVT